MIYCELTQGATTLNLSMGGMEKNSKFYDEGITDVSDFNFALNGAWARLEDADISFLRTSLTGVNINNREFTIKVFLENDWNIFNGSAIIIDNDGVEVKMRLKSTDYTTELLSVDVNNQVIPRVFGSVTHANPLLLDDTIYKYHCAYGTPTTVFDDGLSVAFTDNSGADGTMTLTNAPVGEVSFNVATTTTYLAQIATILSLTLDVTKANTNVVNFFQSTQINAIDALSTFCEYTENIFYITGTTLYIVAKTSFVAQYAKDAFEIMKDGVDIQEQSIVKTIRAEWEVRKPQINPTILGTQTKSLSVNILSDGSTIDITPFDEVNANIQTILNAKKVQIQKSNVLITIADIHVLAIGDELSFDADYASGTLFITGVNYNVIDAQTTVTGLGNVTWS